MKKKKNWHKKLLLGIERRKEGRKDISVRFFRKCEWSEKRRRRRRRSKKAKETAGGDGGDGGIKLGH